MVPTAFEPSVEDLKRLDPRTAVMVLRDILHAEAWLLGVPPTAVVIPLAIDAPDGGVDAHVEGIIRESPHGLIFPGRTCYQVKAGAFSFANSASVKSLIYRPDAVHKKTVTDDDLQSRVKACLDAGGTFVVVLFTSDTPEREEGQHVAAIKAELRRVRAKYGDCAVRIWYPNQLAKFAVVSPPTALKLKGLRAPDGVHSVEWVWKSQGLDGEYVAGDAQRETIERVRSAITAARESAVHLRLVGEPGSGKTRLLYEALNTPGIAPLSIYCPDGDRLVASGFLEQIQLLAGHAPLVLAVDECDAEARSTIHKRLRSAGQSLTIISLYSELDDQDGRNPDYRLLEPPRLADEQVCSIIRDTYGVPPDKAQIVAPFCDGSPRVAHAVGKSLSAVDDIGELLSPIGIDNIWEHFIAGAEGRKSPDFAARYTVLCCLALFKRFGWTNYVQTEAKEIFQHLIPPIDNTLTWSKFVAVVELLQQRKILQGQTTLYISPKLLHIKLWCDWWARCASQYEIPAIFSSFTPALREWLTEMFVYARESAPALRVVEDLFGDDGPYRSLEVMSRPFEGQLLFKVAQAHPKAALRTLKRVLGSATLAELAAFGEGRRYAVHSLEHTALYGECFVDSAECLLRLAEAENENWSNNSTGIFAGLFGLGYGRMAPTELSPQDRLPILRGALLSNQPQRVKLALQGFDQALTTQLVRMDIGPVHGLREVPKGWQPETYGEHWAAYRLYLETLWNDRTQLDDESAAAAGRAILSHVRSLLSIPATASLIVPILKELAVESEEMQVKVIEAVAQVLRYDRKELSEELLRPLEELNIQLTGSSFQGRLRRYVRLNLVEDRINEDHEPENRAAREAATLAAEALDASDLLMPELCWLVTKKAKNGYEFGHALGEIDVPQCFWNSIFTRWREAPNEERSDFFIGGYLGGVFKRDLHLWERLIECLFKSAPQAEFPFLVWRSGMTPRVAGLLLQGAQEGRFEAQSLRVLVYGAVIRNVPRDISLSILRLLVDKGSAPDLEAALELYDSAFMDQKDVGDDSLEIASDILSHDAFFMGGERRHRDNMIDYHWKEVALFLARHSPEAALHLAQKALEHAGDEGGIFGSYSPQSLEFVTFVLKEYPAEMWQQIQKLLGPPIDSRAYWIMQWLRGESGFRSRSEDGALNLIPRDLIWTWIDEQPKERAWYIAHYAPFHLTSSNSLDRSIAREMLERYGADYEVRNSLHANYHTEGWSGPTSLHYEDKRSHLNELLKTEDNANVRRWLVEEIDHLAAAIERERIEEERRGY